MVRTAMHNIDDETIMRLRVCTVPILGMIKFRKVIILQVASIDRL